MIRAAEQSTKTKNTAPAMGKSSIQNCQKRSGSVPNLGSIAIAQARRTDPQMKDYGPCSRGRG